MKVTYKEYKDYNGKEVILMLLYLEYICVTTIVLSTTSNPLKEFSVEMNVEWNTRRVEVTKDMREKMKNESIIWRLITNIMILCKLYIK